MKIKCCGYNIFYGSNTFADIKKCVDFCKYSKVIILTESKIYNLWKDKIERIGDCDVIQIDSGEKMKNIETATSIWQQMVSLGADRKTPLINIGGGMITDLGAFVASSYMRGVDYVNIPTSLLAMVDASIGGKNGVNLGSVKNIIGIFSHPPAVLIDNDFLASLEKPEFISAFGEIVKHSIIFDPKYFKMLENIDNYSDKNEIGKIIEHSLKIKKYAVEKDFKEKNIRKLLNFEHTIGHVIETLPMKTENPLLHSEAVAIGMVIECKIAEKLNMFRLRKLKK